MYIKPWFSREIDLCIYTYYMRMGKISVLRADLGGPRANRIISTKNLDKFVCHLRHCHIVLHHNPLLHLSPSRGTGTSAMGYRSRRFSRTYFHVCNRHAAFLHERIHSWLRQTLVFFSESSSLYLAYYVYIRTIARRTSERYTSFLY